MRRLVFALVGVAAPAMLGQVTLDVVPNGLHYGDQYRLLFVTSTTRDASSANLGDYDLFVQNAVAAATGAGELKTVLDAEGLSPSWQAIGSTPSVDARDHTATIPGANELPIYLIDGSLFASSYVDLWSGTVRPVKPQISEKATLWNAAVWTGSLYDGTGVASPDDVRLGQNSVRYGVSGYTSSRWMDQNTQFANATFSLYGISSPITVVPEPETFAGLTGILLLAFAAWRRKSLARAE